MFHVGGSKSFLLLTSTQPPIRRPHDPIIVHYPRDLKGNQRTFVRFAANSPVIVAGDGQGTVAVMRIYGCEIPFLSHAEQVERILKVVTLNESK